MAQLGSHWNDFHEIVYLSIFRKSIWKIQVELTAKKYNGYFVWCSYLLTYLLTPWSRVLLEKLTGLHLVKKFPTFYGTRRFITAFTSARHLFLS